MLLKRKCKTSHKEAVTVIQHKIPILSVVVLLRLLNITTSLVPTKKNRLPNDINVDLPVRNVMNASVKLFGINTSEYDELSTLCFMGIWAPRFQFVIYYSFKQESLYDFGYAPLTDQVMPQVQDTDSNVDILVFELHKWVVIF